MTRHDHGGHFWGLILPHGLLELTAVFVAGGVGLRLFWSWVEPGQLPRAQSLAREGRTAGTVALGLVAVLLVSGVIEAFVTPVRPADLGPGRRSAILAEAAFLAYVFVLGRAAVHRGHTGDIDAALLEDRVGQRLSPRPDRAGVRRQSGGRECGSAGRHRVRVDGRASQSRPRAFSPR